MIKKAFTPLEKRGFLTGFTLIEMLMTVALFSVLMIASVYMFRAALLAWLSGEARSGADITLDAGMWKIAGDLRPASAVQSSNDEIRFTRDGTNYYIYYFYNAGDSYPVAFTQSSYQVRKGALTGGIGGTFTYGSGTVILTDVLPPPASDLSLTSNVVTINLSVKRGSETVRSKTEVIPRNL
ncbi:MAG: prepilin-type N-terminal cleavage/methylation domain-containing protein [Candidatus Omnitrophota bacterium]